MARRLFLAGGLCSWASLPLWGSTPELAIIAMLAGFVGIYFYYKIPPSGKEQS